MKHIKSSVIRVCHVIISLTHYTGFGSSADISAHLDNDWNQAQSEHKH